MSHLELPPGKALGYEQATLSTSAVFTPTIPANPVGGFAQTALVQCQGANTGSPAIRLKVDGTNPTANVGLLLAKNEFMQCNDNQRIADLRMMADTTDVTKVSITYFA